MRALYLTLLLAVVIAAPPGDGIEGCDGHESRFQLSDQEPVLEATVPNGKKYTYGTNFIIQTTMAESSTLSPSKELPLRWEKPMAP
jgi:hypothetical protein